MAATEEQPAAADAGLPLMQAILHRDLPAVQAALRAVPAALEYWGVSALHAAALADWGAVVPLLVEAGCATLLDKPVPTSMLEACIEGLGYSVPDLHKGIRVPPVFLAVRQGALSAAEALLTAGAAVAGEGDPIVEDFHSAWGYLVDLARLRTAASGSATAAEAAGVPQLVQQMAQLLLDAGLDGPSLAAAHVAAARLAYPQQSPYHHLGSLQWIDVSWVVRCPWLLEHLLQLHACGYVADEAAPDAVYALLEALLGQYNSRLAILWRGIAPGAAPEETVVQWLGVPAAQRMRGDAALRLGHLICDHAMTVAALRVLLRIPGVRAALQTGAEEPAGIPGAVRASLAHRLVVLASAAGGAEALNAVLAAGGAVTLQAVQLVFFGNTIPADRQLHTLSLMLRHSVPPVPEHIPCPSPGTNDTPMHWVSPIYALMDLHANALQQAASRGSRAEAFAALQAQHLRHLRLMECLVDAGYSPTVFRNVEVVRVFWPVLYFFYKSIYFPPDDEHCNVVWELETAGRWLWQAVEAEPWSAATHTTFPPAFRAAARALLLTAHRLPPVAPAAEDTAQFEGVPTLGALPRDVLLRIVQLAAYPLSAWRPALEGGSALESVLARQHNM